MATAEFEASDLDMDPVDASQDDGVKPEESNQEMSTSVPATPPSAHPKSKGKAKAKGKATRARVAPGPAADVKGKGKGKAPAKGTTPPTRAISQPSHPSPPTRGKTANPNIAKATKVANILKQSSDPTRAFIIMVLRGGSLNVGEIVATLKTTQPAVSHHLAIMRYSGIVTPTRTGKNIFYTLTESGEILAETVADMMQRV